MIFFLCFLILFSAFLSGSETALFSLSPLTLKAYKSSINPRLKLISKLMARPREILVTILILNIFANIFIQNTVSAIFDSFQSWWFTVGVPLVITLIFGEFLPKSLALPNHAKVAYWVSPLLYFAAKILRPVRNPLTRATSAISHLFFFFLKKEKEISAEELRHVLKTSEETGVLMRVESDLISGTLDLQHSQVKEHMRPREEILLYDLNEPLSDLIELFTSKQISRVPVCDGDLEKIQGVLSIRNFFFHQNQIKTGKDLFGILKKPYYIPESTRSWSALRGLREKGISLAIVVDEYGAISGLITQEDLVEVVVGEITDVRDSESLYTRSSEDVIIASGKMELKEFEEVFGMSLPSESHVVTLGGWLIEQLGDIPVAGTKYATDDFLFYVLGASPNRIQRIYVRRLKR